MVIMPTASRFIALTLIALGSFGSACSKEDDGLTAHLMEANNKVLSCQKDLTQAKDQIGALKKQLAQALAEPSKVVLTDPDIIELVASRRNRPMRSERTKRAWPTIFSN